MWYTIYNNIDKAEFDFLKAKIAAIENDAKVFIEVYNFVLNRDASYKEYLGVDFLFDSGKYAGSIGFVYDEDMSYNDNRLFKFYILKSYDSGRNRFFKKIFLEERYSLDVLQVQAERLFNECVAKFNLITESTSATGAPGIPWVTARCLSGGLCGPE